MVLIAGPRSGSADAIPAPASNDSARPPLAAASLLNERVTICGIPSEYEPPNLDVESPSLPEGIGAGSGSKIQARLVEDGHGHSRDVV